MKKLGQALKAANSLVERGECDKAAEEIRPQAGRIIRIAERQEVKRLFGMVREAVQKDVGYR
jgi:hypothetical protein